MVNIFLHYLEQCGFAKEHDNQLLQLQRAVLVEIVLVETALQCPVYCLEGQVRDAFQMVLPFGAVLYPLPSCNPAKHHHLD